MNVDALRTAGAAARAQVAPLDPETIELRATFDPAFARELHADRAYHHGPQPRTPSTGRYNAGYRCRACKRMVSGPLVPCRSCGAIHGGVYGPAETTR